MMSYFCEMAKKLSGVFGSGADEPSPSEMQMRAELRRESLPERLHIKRCVERQMRFEEGLQRIAQLNQGEKSQRLKKSV